MADYGFNTNLGPQAQQATSLGDMVQLARGVQAYQQAEQANPLALQKARMEIEQLQKMNPLAVQKATAETGAAELGLSQKQTDALYGLAGGVLNDPRMKSDKKEDVLGALYEARQRASTYKIPQQTIDGVFNPLMELGAKNPKGVQQSIKNIVETGIGATGQQALQSGAVVEINGVKYQFNPSNGQMKEVGTGGGAPALVPSAAPSPAPAQRPTGLVQMDMPVANSANPQMNTAQRDRYAAGVDILNKSSELAQAAGDSRQTIRQIQQNISQAAGSKPEQIIRNAKKWAVGSEQLDELVKSLADNQMRQAQMMGVGTDAARQTAGLASGSENITAGALKMITDRAEATNTAFEKFNQGLNSFKNKFGQYNGAIHADNFKRAWQQNYDPLVFWVQNINASDMSKAQKQMEISKLLKGLSDEQRQSLAKKAENIKRLEKGDF